MEIKQGLLITICFCIQLFIFTYVWLRSDCARFGMASIYVWCRNSVLTTIFTQWRIIRFFAFILQSGGAATGKRFSLPGNPCDTTNCSRRQFIYLYDALLTPAGVSRRRFSFCGKIKLDSGAKNGVTPLSMSLRKPSHR